ncbi:transcriptional regulator, RpiR family [Verminephrobacter eiseniae EF01-2]|uniref:Transcriptional regulator, RpiR family n=1 Tax=Verminephrobacter eiseniae (strain EF01-2) TaxID=391735 RepID=A1WQC0_VEREI|nr:transcriptional regulator, RpiR family [Verminephrobacter eiseniae EF01-2]MCW5285340.1 MurR/RpiR family transcriptional regulator [Verminephrobacter eiseniae]MCW5303047.1 MurR/RpiR family transcriptional regulator [Verminephrobacter eiseniae]MCW8181408.1 MurR/RpiR family transcriptional regulator [Verminephrobacter eiseniae]MCW8190484.1 MurR/RpiR family transcriptional regulator [Verminephrobacter eiseniae]
MDGDGPIASNAFIGAFIGIHRHLRRFPCPLQDAPCAHDDPFDVAKDFQTLIAERQSTMTQLEQRVAVYLRSNPDAILVDTSNTIAERAFVSPMTVTRFFRKLGFDSAAAVKKAVRQRFASQVPSAIGSRFDQFQRQRTLLDKNGDVKDAVTAIRQAAQYRSTPMWARIVELIAHSDSVFAAGFQTMSYLANGLVSRLNYIRANVHELDGADGVYAPFFADRSARRTLIIIDHFRYGRNGPVLAKVAREQGAEVIIFCDEHCNWAAGITAFVVTLPSEPGFFFRPTMALHFCMHMLVQDVIDMLGEPVRRQLQLLSEAQELFGQFQT